MESADIMQSMKKRIVSFELLRIIACLYVITIHILYDYRVQAGIAWNVIFMESFVRCCVPIFFILTGYFIFQREKSIKEMYRKVFFEIVCPVFFLSLVNSIFVEAMYNKRTLWQCIREYQIENVIEMFKGFLRMEYPSPSAHLWYINALVGIYMMYPLLKHICTNDVRANKVRRYLMVLLFITLVFIPTVARMFLGTNRAFTFPLMITAYYYLYVFIGYELRYLRLQGKHKWLGLLGYILGSMITFALCVLEVYVAGELKLPFFDYQMLGVFISALGLFLFFKELNLKSEKLVKIILSIARQTYMIYLIHFIFLATYSYHGVRGYLENALPKALFYIVYIGVCFVSALAGAYCCSYVQGIMKKYLCRKKENRRGIL